jgi:hypothetical protein
MSAFRSIPVSLVDICKVEFREKDRSSSIIADSLSKLHGKDENINEERRRHSTRPSGKLAEGKIGH